MCLLPVRTALENFKIGCFPTRAGSGTSFLIARILSCWGIRYIEADVDPIEYRIMYSVEDTHWWYLGMNTIFSEIVKRQIPQKSYRILDSGCGTGGAAEHLLRQFGSVVEMDLSLTGLGYCKKRTLKDLVCGSVGQLPLQTASFDLVASFDVLYEKSVPDVRTAIIEVSRILMPGGYFVLRVPAYDWLRGRHDEAVNTGRRFTRREISRLVIDSGFDILHSSYVNAILFPLALGKRLGEKLFPKSKPVSDFYVPGKLVNRLLAAILRAEAPVVSRFGLPFGLSIALVAQKPL